MIKRLNKVLFAIALFSVFALTCKASENETLGDFRRSYNNLVAQEKANANKTAEEKAKIKQNEANIAAAEEAISKAKMDMHNAEVAIEESNKKIEELEKEANSVLIYLQQMQGENAYVEYISGAASMTDLITRISAVEQVSDHIRVTMENLEAEIKRNEELKVELQKKKEALEKEKVAYEEAIKKSYENIAEYDKYAVSIDKQVENAKKELDMYVDLCKNTINDTSDNVKISDCTSAGIPYNAGWLKPLNYGVTTSTVQYYRSLGSLSGTHNAIDIGGNAEGTSVYAAAAGVVAGKIYHYSCGGNMLYINVTVGGKNYTTYYYHLLNFAVDVGDIVTQNTVIGYVGGGYGTPWDYCSTGAHLHYGVANGWYNGYNIKWADVIIPPGFPNQTGYRFYNRYDYWG